jgi:hypothetical protein
MTIHRYPTPLAQQARRVAVGAAGLFGLAVATTAWGPVVATGVGAATAGLTVGVVVSRPIAARRWAAARRVFARNDQPPPLPPPPDLSRPLAEVLPPYVPRTSSVFTPRESPLMPAAAVAEPEAATVVLSPLPPEYAAELEGAPVLADAVLPGRWLTLGEMHPADRFLMPWSDRVLELARTDQPTEVKDLGMVLALVHDGDRQLSLSLSADQRWRMVRALRHAAVRCMVCAEVREDLEGHTYDLAAMVSHVEAVCASCERNTVAAL